MPNTGKKSQNKTNGSHSDSEENYVNKSVEILQTRINQLEQEKQEDITKNNELLNKMMEKMQTLERMYTSVTENFFLTAKDKPMKNEGSTSGENSDSSQPKTIQVDAQDIDNANDSKSWYQATKEIEDLTKLKFDSHDTATKVTTERMLRMRQLLLGNVTKLRNLKPDENINILGDADRNWVETKTTYCWWKRDILKYYSLLSPKFYNWIMKTIPTIDFDKMLDDPNFKLPELPAEIQLQSIDLLEATMGTQRTINDEYKHLVADIEPLDVAKAFFNVFMYFEPNSVDTRSDSLSEFYTVQLPDNMSIDLFASLLREKQQSINIQAGTQLITEHSLVSTLRSAVKKSGQREAYQNALASGKQHSQTLQQFLGHLKKYVDKSKLPTKPTAQANMARTRGGTRQGTSRGRGGRGGKGSTRGGRGGTSRSNSTNTKQETYLATKDKDGNLLVGKTVQIQRSIKQPCWYKVARGSCTRNDCPYNHKFNIIQLEEAPSNTQESKQRDKDQDAQENDGSSTPAANIATLANEEEENEENYDHEDFFGAHSASFDVHDNGLTAMLAKPKQPTISEATLLKAVSCYLLLPLSLTFMCLCILGQQSFSILSKLSYLLFSTIWYTLKLIPTIPTYLTKALLRISYQVENKFWCCNAKCDTRTTPKNPILLDSGASGHLSGDYSLFVKNSLVPYRTPITLADSNKKSFSTHMGKICINGNFLDALYVPEMQHTLISMGALIKEGISSASDAQGDIHLYQPNSKSSFLTFKLSSNNLYFLVDSAFAGSA
jgi:hypothetical protein